MRKLNIKDNKGFTIIEVLIVLAIAGLILIVVLLAVPALQRNSRNTTMKNDATAAAGAVSEYISNNNGKVPTGTPTVTNDVLTITGPAGSVGNISTAQLKAGTAVVTATPTAPGQIQIRTGHKCDPSNQPTPIANSRGVAILYTIESGSTFAIQCVDA